jgi:hypothetical protein
MNIELMTIQLFLLLRNVSMNKPMLSTESKGPTITHTRKHTTLVGEITQISIGRVIIIMHKLHNHRFKHTIIFKILMDMHLLMLHLLEKILRRHCMHSLKSKRQSTLNLLKAYFDNFPSENESIGLKDPVDKG